MAWYAPAAAAGGRPRTHSLDRVLPRSLPQPPFYSRDVTEMYERILHDRLRFPDVVPMIARQWLEVRAAKIMRQLLEFPAWCARLTTILF